jgi:hypothetical protein
MFQGKALRRSGQLTDPLAETHSSSGKPFSLERDQQLSKQSSSHPSGFE